MNDNARKRMSTECTMLGKNAVYIFEQQTGHQVTMCIGDLVQNRRSEEPQKGTAEGGIFGKTAVSAVE